MQDDPSTWAAIGLTSQDVHVYRTLLRHPDLDPGSLDGDSLRRLTHSGLIERFGNGFRPVDPRLSVGGLIRSRRADLDRLDRVADDLATDFHEGMLRTEPERLTEVIDGPAAVARHAQAMLESAEDEVLALDTPPYVASGPAPNPAELALLARGVRCRAIYAHEVLDLPDKLRLMEESIAAGEQARVCPRLPMKLIIVDRRLALLPLTSSDEGRRNAAVVVRRSALIDALVALFETLWAQATPLRAEAGEQASAGPVPANDQALLNLLGAGMKDEAIGRALGLSERTLRRRITELHERLGASSRFQAGLQAARHGWL